MEAEVALVARNALEKFNSIVCRQVEEWVVTNDNNFADGVFGEATFNEYLAARLNRDGLLTTVNRCYPNSKETCDLVTSLAPHIELWTEAKGAWLMTRPCVDCNGKHWAGMPNGSFRKHLLGNSQSCARDIAYKLPRSPRGSWQSQLIVGFDSVNAPMDAAICELVTKACLKNNGWTCVERHWANPSDDRYRVHLWLYQRAPFAVA